MIGPLHFSPKNKNGRGSRVAQEMFSPKQNQLFLYESSVKLHGLAYGNWYWENEDRHNAALTDCKVNSNCSVCKTDVEHQWFLPSCIICIYPGVVSFIKKSNLCWGSHRVVGGSYWPQREGESRYWLLVLQLQIRRIKYVRDFWTGVMDTTDEESRLAAAVLLIRWGSC